MNKCVLCRWERGAHDPACPEVAEDKQQALKDNRRGYYDGRGGFDMADSETPSYKLGYLCGVVALEEAENGYDIRWG